MPCRSRSFAFIWLCNFFLYWWLSRCEIIITDCDDRAFFIFFVIGPTISIEQFSTLPFYLVILLVLMSYLLSIFVAKRTFASWKVEHLSILYSVGAAFFIIIGCFFSYYEQDRVENALIDYLDQHAELIFV